MNFCSHCGRSVSLKIPEDDNRPRHVCDSCGNIHYQNPKIVAGCIPEWQGKILLCRRAIEPRYGLWTIPAGYMENGETLEQAACRETEEEACARIALDGLYAVEAVGEVLKLLARFFAYVSAVPDELEHVDVPVARDGVPSPSALSHVRVTLHP